MPITQLGYLGLGVSDVAEWEQYATEVLGLQVNGREEDGSMRLRMDQYSYRFILHPSGEDDLIFAGWEVKDEVAMRELESGLRAYGIDVEDATPDLLEARDVVGMIRFNDPAGLSCEVYYGPYLEKVNRFVSSQGVEFETGENGNMGLGHMVVAVPDLAESTRFYRDVMGLRISDFIDSTIGGLTYRFAFFHANQRHHSIAFGSLVNPGPDDSLQPWGNKRLNHIMLQTTRLDSVGLALDRARERQIPSGSLGQHTNDHMLSFYLRTPSGFNIEYGWGGREVDDGDWEVQYYKEGSIWGHGRPQPAAKP